MPGCPGWLACLAWLGWLGWIDWNDCLKSHMLDALEEVGGFPTLNFDCRSASVS